MKDYSNHEITRVIEEWIHCERDRAILYDRYVNGLVFEKLAEKYDMSVRQIKNIIYRSQDKIFKHL